MRDSDQYYTPPHIFQTLRVRFDLDVCSPPGGVSWVPARRYLTETDDGLRTPWKGRVWMNPPFSNPQPWVEKFIAHGNGIALVPVSKSRWFMKLWETDLCLCFPDPHLKFIRHQKPAGIFMPIIFVAAGLFCQRRLHRLGVVRTPQLQESTTS